MKQQYVGLLTICIMLLGCIVFHLWFFDITIGSMIIPNQYKPVIIIPPKQELLNTPENKEISLKTGLPVVEEKELTKDEETLIRECQ